MRKLSLVVALSCLAVSACEIGTEGSGLQITIGREARDDFVWTGQLADGQRLEVKGVAGGIVAEGATGPETRVTATRRGFRSDPNAVRVEVVEHDEGITICAVYPGGDNECRPGSGGRLRSDNNDVKVEFAVGVPAGVDFVGRTVNGGVKASGLQGSVAARSVNGSITIDTTGPARAETVNGSIRVTLGSLDGTEGTVFETVNGNVTITLPPEIDAAVDLQTTSGGIASDLPLTIARSDRRHLQGRLGDGGRALQVKTVNGSIRLRERD